MSFGFTRRRAACAALMLTALTIVASCGDQSKPPAAEPAPAAPVVSNEHEWIAVPPAKVINDLRPVKVSVTSSLAGAVFPKTAVAKGQALTANATITGPADRVVIVVLQRHCHDASGVDDATLAEFTLTGQPQDVTVNHTFARAFDCVRVSFVSKDMQPLELTIDNVSLASP